MAGFVKSTSSSIYGSMERRICSDSDTNFARITCLLMEVGTYTMAKAVSSHLHPCHLNLQAALKDYRNKFEKLMRQNRIQASQYSILYPDSEDTETQEDRIDMTLWFLLARNVTVGCKNVKWAENPKWSDVLWQHEVIRLKNIRNYLFHLNRAELSESEFTNVCLELVKALKNLGVTDDTIEQYLSRDLDREMTRRCYLSLQEQVTAELQQAARTAARDRAHLRMVILLVSLVCVILAISIPMMVIYLKPQPPCSENLIHVTGKDGVLNYMKRAGWGARPPLNTDKKPLIPLKLPMKIAGIIHTAFVQTDCSVTEDCCKVVQYLQTLAMNGGHQDIAFNFMIANDGVVYEGRGLNQGSAIRYRNPEVLSIAMLGNFMCEPPGRTGMMALYVLLDVLKRPWDKTIAQEPVLDKNYSLYGHCQLYIVTKEHNKTFHDSPGAALMKEIMHWEHWKSDNKSQCIINKDCLRSSCCCDPCNSTVF